MFIPVFENIKFTGDDGLLTPEWRAILQILFQSLQTNFSNYGLVMPSQTTAVINQLTNSLSGSMIYNSTTGVPEISINGTWKILAAGVIPIYQGGTGATTQADAITALTGTQTDGYYLRSDGTNAELSPLQATDITGVVAIEQGGTGQITQQLAINALAGSMTDGEFLRGDGTNVTMSAIQITDLPYTTPIQLSTDTTINGNSLTIGVPYTYQSVASPIITLTIIGGIVIRNPPVLNGSSSTIGFNNEDVFALTRYSDSTILIT